MGLGFNGCALHLFLVISSGEQGRLRSRFDVPDPRLHTSPVDVLDKALLQVVLIINHIQFDTIFEVWHIHFCSGSYTQGLIECFFGEGYPAG